MTIRWLLRLVDAANNGEHGVSVHCFDPWPGPTSSSNVLKQKPPATLPGDPRMSGYCARVLMVCVHDLHCYPGALDRTS